MAIAARVNHGRWIVDCPACPSAALLEQAQEEGPSRGACRDCGAPFGLVVVPGSADRRALEDALARRPVANQNWEPGETLADLLVENELQGVAS